MTRYQECKPGEWNSPVMVGYKTRCCDCGLVHRIDFKVVHSGRGHGVEFRATRDVRATAARRKRRKMAEILRG